MLVFTVIGLFAVLGLFGAVQQLRMWWWRQKWGRR